MVDTIGAGDSFQAALLFALQAMGRSEAGALAGIGADELRRALSFAARCAAITCSRPGADPPRRAEIAADLARFRQIVRREPVAPMRDRLYGPRQHASRPGVGSLLDAQRLDDRPPPGFLRIDFDRGRPDPTFNSHIGNLYAKRGEKGTRDEFVMGFRVHQHMCNPAGGLHGGMMMTVADLVGTMGGGTLVGPAQVPADRQHDLRFRGAGQGRRLGRGPLPRSCARRARCSSPTSI